MGVIGTPFQEKIYVYWVGPARSSQGLNVVSDEDEIGKDSDEDGIYDFDETRRFHTYPNLRIQTKTASLTNLKSRPTSLT